jgi:SAM-dependent methyltransferase
MADPDDFDALVAEAESRSMEGWDFSFFKGRDEVEPEPWDYRYRVEHLAGEARAMADLGTGGGEFVASLGIRAPLTIATEGWLPNVPVADQRLRPLGVHVVAVEGAPDNAQQRFLDLEGRLPFRDSSFDLVIDRHEAFRATEVARVLRPGGTFLTQQVGSLNEIELNEALGGDVAPCLSPTLDEYVGQLERAGLLVTDAREAFPEKRYLDVGVLIFFLRAVPWQYEGFDVGAHREALLEIHKRIAEDGAFVAHMHRFLLEARKPDQTSAD